MTNHRLTRWLKLCLGVAFLIGGGALLFRGVGKTDLASSMATNGLSLLTLVTVALGLALLGASVEFFGLGQRRDEPPKVRNTKVYGDAEPASEREAKAAARGDVRTTLRDRTFSK